MEHQSLTSQKGEIEFRKKLVQQQVEGETVFDDELDAATIEAVLQQRMRDTVEQMRHLLTSGIPLAPFVEIGAERGQRSLALENELGLSGAAVDLSYHMLQSARFYQDRFNQPKMPLRICCDVHCLPFRTGSLPFVFCYETLHHFPNPKPVADEVHRVLAPGGCFFFHEEPVGRFLHWSFYRRNKIYSEKARRRNPVQKVCDFFFAGMACNEIEHGIIENHDLSVGQWKKALGSFPKRYIQLGSRLSRGNKPLTLSSAAWTRSFRLRDAGQYFLTWLLGGVISGMCRKAGDLLRPISNLQEALTCPHCLDQTPQPHLAVRENAYLCSRCGRDYPVADGVVFLFRADKMEELYPEVRALSRSGGLRGLPKAS